MAVPYTFGTATAAIPLSQLDTNFATAITLGNTAVYLGNTTTSIGNLTLTNVTISSGSVTITDTTVSGNVTLSGGTANGVAYLNGSKVLATGGALTFDGTNLGVTRIAQSGSGTYGAFNSSGAGNAWASYQYASSEIGEIGQGSGLISGGSNTDFGIRATNNLVFGISYNEQMRLTSTGLGIGTSSIGAKLQVSSGATALAAYISSTATPAYSATSYNGANALLNLVSGGASGAFNGMRLSQGGSSELLFGVVQEAGGAGAFVWQGYSGSAYAERLRLDSSGNLGLGVTPSAWGSSFKVLQLGSNSSISDNGFGDAYMASNWRFDGTTSRYITSDFALQYAQENGAHKWSVAPSGTAGNAITFTQAMTLNASNQLGVGTTSPSAIIHSSSIGLGDGGGIKIQNTGSGGATFAIWPTATINGEGAGKLIISGPSGNAVTIDSSGNLLVGTTTAYGLVTFTKTTETTPVLVLKNPQYSMDSWATNTTGDNIFVRFLTEASATQRGGIAYNRAGGVVAYNTTSDYRAKDIIGPVVSSGALIDSVPVYMGKMKGATQERPMFIAHETPAYAHTGEKDAVDENGNPKYQQMDASVFIPVMWAEIQSLRKRLTALEAK